MFGKFAKFLLCIGLFTSSVLADTGGDLNLQNKASLVSRDGHDLILGTEGTDDVKIIQNGVTTCSIDGETGNATFSGAITSASGGVVLQHGNTRTPFPAGSDDAAARYEALAAAYAAGVDGDTIEVSAGTYSFDTNTITLKDGVNIFCYPGAVFSGTAALFSNTTTTIDFEMSGDCDIPRATDEIYPFETASFTLQNTASNIKIHSKNFDFPLNGNDYDIQKKNAAEWINGGTSVGKLGVSMHYAIQSFENYADIPSEFGTGLESPSLWSPSGLTKAAIHAFVEQAAKIGATSFFMTTKHIAGWTMWPSKVTTQGIQSTDWYKTNQIDIVKEVVDATRARGMQVGFYFCPTDLYFDANFDETDSGKYSDYNLRQLEELLTWYGKIDYIIFDCIPWASSYDLIGYNEIIKQVRKWQPNIVISSNNHEHSILNTNVDTLEITAGDNAVTGVSMLNENWMATRTSLYGGNCGTRLEWFDHPDSSQQVTPGYCISNLTYFEGLARSSGNKYIYNLTPTKDGAIPSDLTTFFGYRNIRGHNNVVQEDDFLLNGAETLGTTLGNHVNDNSKTWTAIFGSDLLRINPNGKLTEPNGSTGGQQYTFNETPADANYNVSVEWGFLTLPTSWKVELDARTTDTSHNYDILCGGEATPGFMGCSLNYRNGGAWVRLGADVMLGSYAYSATDTFKAVLRVNGTTIQAWIYKNNILVNESVVTDNHVASTGKAALVVDSNPGSSTTGLYIEHFKLFEDDTTAPSAPTSFAVGRSGKSARFTWTDPVAADLYKVRVKYSTDGTNYYVLGTAEPAAQQFTTVDFLDPNQTYYFVAEALDNDFNISSASSVLTSYGANNKDYKTDGAGTSYTLTATPAAVDLGTTDPVITLTEKGTYNIEACVTYQNSGATYASSRTMTYKLRRTNNTAGDLTGGSVAIPTGIVTTETSSGKQVCFGVQAYQTANTDDALTIFADVSVLPSAGSTVVQASGTFIKAKRIA